MSDIKIIGELDVGEADESRRGDVATPETNRSAINEVGNLANSTAQVVRELARCVNVAMMEIDDLRAARLAERGQLEERIEKLEIAIRKLRKGGST